MGRGGLSKKDRLNLTIQSFAELGLAEPLQRALTDEKYLTPTPIQAQAIPLVLGGRDLLGIAQTGTGKTAAFALPILHRLAEKRVHAGPRRTRALILAPTRELAIQIGEGFRTYGKHLGLRHAVVFGGVGHRAQIEVMARGVDVLVATPGRLLDLMGQNRVRLDAVSVLVLDEADRMLDMGFIRDVRRIAAELPQQRQSLLFSATMPAEVAELTRALLKDPVRVEVTPTATPIERIEQRVFHVEAARKRSLLTELLADPALGRVIVFTRTKHGADRVAEHLDRAGIQADAIHGNKSQNQRQRTLSNFHAGDLRVLVATDIAARGIDVDDVTHVINFELPHEPDSYVHRIGRTARAGASGVAISFCDPAERGNLRAIERLTKRTLTVIGAAPPNNGPAGDQDHAANDDRRARSGQKPGQKNNNKKRRRFRGNFSRRAA
jgi:ATP-dependent RNA helicase RhlE